MQQTSAEKPGVKEKITHELRRLLGIFTYLSIFFLVFRLYTRLILSEFQINYVEYGLTLLKALALAKVVLTAEALRLGERFHERPLIVPTFYKTVVFSLFALAFEVVEHFVLGALERKGPSTVVAEMLKDGWPHMASMTLVIFVAFLPYFAFRETERVLGEDKLWDLFFKRSP